jgi:EAL domain-containing protein (putative c-di-GMP-specific phosphodiesterase class I)
MLELEITESASLEDFASVSALIDQCRSELGVTFSLDDFGAGYSSLTYLRRLPADVVKIDQSFVRDMLRDPEDLAIVAGVISLAREFNRKVIAEGVETAEHGVKLLAMNCELAQGYGIARPMPAAAVPDWVDNYEPDATWISPYANLKLIR